MVFQHTISLNQSFPRFKSVNREPHNSFLSTLHWSTLDRRVQEVDYLNGNHKANRAFLPLVCALCLSVKDTLAENRILDSLGLARVSDWKSKPNLRNLKIQSIRNRITLIA